MNQSSPPYPPVQQVRTSTMAIISLITGILGFVQILPFIGPIAAIITGHIAKGEIKRSGGLVTGDGLATAGLILGYLMLAIGLCALCVFVIFPLLGIGLTIPFLNSGY
ncbi:MAG: DUF4190 domain-containing protein [Anaerolineales bacterium]